VAVVPPLAECLRRNALRSGPARLADAVVQHVAQRFEAVQSEVGWERWSLTLDAVPTATDEARIQALVVDVVAHPMTAYMPPSQAQLVSHLLNASGCGLDVWVDEPNRS
jgi:tRNA uridine 5-carbamoylmethylation protein Kti12